MVGSRSALLLLFVAAASVTDAAPTVVASEAIDEEPECYAPRWNAEHKNTGTNAALGRLFRRFVDSGRVPADTVVLHGRVDVHDATPVGNRWDPDTADLGLFRGLLGKKPTLRWQNQSYIVEALRRRGCFEVAPWPLSVANQLCIGQQHGATAALVASSRRRTAFWPGDTNYRYIFHGLSSSEGDALRAMILRDLPMDSLAATFGVDFIRGTGSRRPGRNTFFLGSRGTNSVLHVHTAAINALVVGGPKVWITAPESSKDAVARFSFGRVTNQSVSDWLLTHLDFLLDNVPGLAIFVQREGDVVFLPHFQFHATVNLGYNVGASFAFFEKNCNGNGHCMDRWEDVLQIQSDSMDECFEARVCRKPERCMCRPAWEFPWEDPDPH